jgi:hypothetical protein
MSKQQTRIVDLSEFGGAPSKTEAPKIVDLSEFTQKKNLNETPNADTGLFGGMFSTAGGSDKNEISKKFFNAMSYAKGLFSSDDSPEVKQPLTYGQQPEGGFRAVSTAIKTFVPQTIASVSAVAGGVLENIINDAKDVADFYSGTSDYSIGNFFTNLEKQAKIADETVKQKGNTVSTALSLEHQGHDHLKSSESIAAPLYDLAAEAQKSADVLFDVSQKQWGIKEENRNKSIFDLTAEGDYKDAFKIAGLGVARSMPQSIALAMTGGSAGVFAGAGISAGGAELAKEYSQTGDITGEDAFRAIGYGVGEGLSEMLFQGDLMAIKSLGKSIFNLTDDAVKASVKTLVKEEGKQVAKEKIARSFLDGGISKMLKGGLEEGVEEIAATVSNFAVDRILDGNISGADYNKLMKDAVDSFVIGAMSGGLMSGSAALATHNPLSKEQQQRVDKFMEVANNEELSQEVRDMAKSKADEIIKYDADRHYAEYTQLANLPLQDRIKAVAISNEIKTLEENKKEIKDVETISEIDKKIEEKSQEVKDIIDNHTLNLADEVINSNEAIDGKVAFSNETQLNVNPDTGYVFHFDSPNEVPAELKKIEPISSGVIAGRDKSVFRVAYTGQDLINAGLATQASEITPEQVSQASADVETTANTVQEILDKAPDTLGNIPSMFQEQEGKTIAQQIAEEYQKAKQDNSNPELVSQVESAITNSLTAPTMAAQPVIAPKPKRKRNVQTLRGMKPTEGVELTDNIVNDFTGVLGKMSRGTKQVLQNYVKALKSVRPEAKVFYYEDAVAMEKGLKNSGFSPSKAKSLASSSGGLFTTVNDGGEVIIHVNRQADLSKKGQDAGQQSNLILAHEIVHATLLELARTNPSEFKNMRDSLLTMLAKDEAANEEVKAFVERYSNQSEEVQAEEFLAQLGALLTRQKATLQRSTLDKIKLAIRQFLQKVAGKFRSKALMDLVDSEVFAETAKIEDTAQFLEGLGKSLREGTDINMKYIKNLVKGSKEYQAGLRYSVIENAPSIPQGMDANTLMDNDMVVEPENVKQSVDEGNWTDNAENRKRMTKYMSTIKGMTEDDIWLAKAIAYNENKGVKLYTLKDKESVIAALENQLNNIVQSLDNEIVGQYEFANEGTLWESNGGYLFTGWKPEYIANRIILFKNDLNTNEVLRWTEIRDNENYHKQEVGVIREMQKNALLANIKEFNGHNDFDPAFSYMLINSMIYNKYQVANEETGEIKVFKYKQNQLSSTDATYASLQYSVAKALYDSEKSRNSADEIGIQYQKTYMNMDKLNVQNSKFAKYIDKKSSTGEGYWLKFPKGDNPEVAYDLFEIAKTSHKYPAKWCTGSSDSTAASQLRGGDFYMFVDSKTGDARIAVKYNNDSIGEVRGLGEGQAILAKDSGIIEEISDTFKDGKSYESYSKTLNDTKKIAKEFFTKEEFETFQEKNTSGDSLLGNSNNFIKYIGDNFSVDDIARILIEEDRSYNQSDYFLQNIQGEINSYLKLILENKGESPYAIVHNFFTSPSNLGTINDVKYVIDYLSIDEDVNFENLIYAKNIGINDGELTANKLKTVNNLQIENGALYSKSLEIASDIDAREGDIIVPNLKKVSDLKIGLFGNGINDFSSLEQASRISININSNNVKFDFPKLISANRISFKGGTEIASKSEINLPSIDGKIKTLTLSGYNGSDVNVNINKNVVTEIENIIISDSIENELSINAQRADIREINVYEGQLNINLEDGANIKLIDGTGTVAINNVTENENFTTDIKTASLHKSAKLIFGENQTVSMDEVEMRNDSSIDGKVNFINTLRIYNPSITTLSVGQIEKLKVNAGMLMLRDNKYIDLLNINGATASISSERIGVAEGFSSQLLASNLQSVDGLLFQLNETSELFLPNLIKVNNRLTLSGKANSSKINLSKLNEATQLDIYDDKFELLSLKNAKIITLKSGTLEARQLQSTSIVTLEDGSDLYAPQLKNGYKLQSLYGEFNPNENNNRIFDENGGQTFPKQAEPSDVKSSLGDIGQAAREEHKRRTEKTAKQRVAEIYNNVFERNEEARQAFKKADMPFSMYSMYLKAGASPFAMKKFADAYFNIYGGLNEKQIHNLDSVIFLERVIAIDENFDNRGKKRPAHPDIIENNGTRRVVNRESAIAELDAYEKAFGKEYVDDLRARAKEYFNTFSEILKYKYDNGLISKETYELYKDYNYSPRKFIEHIVDVNGVPVNAYINRGIKLGAEEIKNITTGSTDLMLINSADLLKMAMISAENRVFTNRALKFIFEEGVTRNNNIVKDAKVVKLKDGTIKLDKDGVPVVKQKADEGFVYKTYRDNNGKAYTFQMRSDIAKQFDDSDISNNKETYKKILAWVSGAPILRNLAVTLNPFFGLVNPIIDLGTQVMFSNTYKGAGRGLLAQSFAATKEFVSITNAMIGMDLSASKVGKKFGLSESAKQGEIRQLMEEYGVYGGFMTTQSEVGQDANKLASALSYYGNVTEIAAKLSAYKFLKQTMLNDFAKENIDPATGESIEPNEKQMRDIMISAAYHARATLDYNRGGKWAKDMSQYIPFLNVSLQVKKVGGQYIVDNKADFIRKMADGIFVTAAITLANLLISDDDYEKDKRIKRDKVDKTIIMLPFLLENGERAYVALPTPSFAKVFFNAGQVMAEQIYYDAVGKVNPNEGSSVSKIIENNFSMMAREIKGTFMPKTIQATISYLANYDFWTQDRLTKDERMVASQQGYGNENIMSSLKLIAQGLDKLTDKEGIGYGGGAFTFSPEKLQKSMEVITTSPTYNGLANTAYWMLDNLFQAGHKVMLGKDIDEKLKSKFNTQTVMENIADTFGKGFGRLVRFTDPSKYNLPDFDANQDLKEEINLVDARLDTKKSIMYKDLMKIYDDSKEQKNAGEFIKKEVEAYRDKIKDPREYNYINSLGQLLIDRTKVQLGTNVDKYYMISTEAKDARAKAFAIWKNFGDIRGNEALLNDLKNIGIDQSVINQYRGILIQNNMIEVDKDRKPIYEEWYKSMINALPKKSPTPPLSAVGTPSNGVSVSAVANTINASEKVSSAVANIFNAFGDEITGVGDKVADKINVIHKAIEANPIYQNVKEVAANPDLILAAIQREIDKRDESGTVSKKIVVPKQVTPEFSLTGGKPIVASDTVNLGNMRGSNSEYLATSSITDLNKVNVGERNRGDYKEGQGNIIANFLAPFTKPENLNNNDMYVGIKDGKLVTGNGSKVKDAQSVTKTPFAQVVEITDELIKNQSYLFPKLKTLKEGQENKLNISATREGKGDANNKFAGGATIIETPDGSQKYLVRGSLDQVKSAFNDLKKNTNSPYLNMYILDNGSFSTGLFTGDKKSTEEELKAYESKNINGGHGIYLK